MYCFMSQMKKAANTEITLKYICRNSLRLSEEERTVREGNAPYGQGHTAQTMQ
jgi:hypothetical protein